MSNEADKLEPIHPKEFILDALLRLVFEKVSEKEFDTLDAMAFDGQPIDEDSAEILSKAFGTSKQMWLNLQRKYDAES